MLWSKGRTTEDPKSFDVAFADVPSLELAIDDISDLEATDFGAIVCGGNVLV